jgi:D-glycero-D-manno-heptose 1,7-bisphosphate phosphatase
MTVTGDKAVFLDRDGVLNDDVHLITHPEQFRILPGVPAALTRIAQAGFHLIVVSNQPVAARGMISEPEIDVLHEYLRSQISKQSGPRIEAFYFCPHHPNADVAEYRKDCTCRKPRPGMIRQASRDHGIDLTASFMIGDRITDVIAGSKAGCRTIQVTTGKENDAPIQGADPKDLETKPDYICDGLPAAVEWILNS